MSVLKNLKVLDSVKVLGDFDVKGTTTSVNTVNLNVKDPIVYLNKDYTLLTPTLGGLAINTKAVVAGQAIQSITGNVITVINNTNIAAGDIVQISGATNGANDGVYVVQTLGTTVTITIGDSLNTPFDNVVQTSIASNQTGVAGTITHISLTVVLYDENGDTHISYGDSITSIDNNYFISGNGEDKVEVLITTTENKTAIAKKDMPRIYICDTDTAGGVMTLSLPTTANNAAAGRRFTIIRKGANNVIVVSGAADGFDGDSGTTSITLDTDASKLEIMYSDKAGLDTWYIV